MVLQKQHIPFQIGDQISILCTFLLRNDLSTLFVAKNHLRTFIVTKTIYALCPESFCALNFAIQKIQTFWASGGQVAFCNPNRKQDCPLQKASQSNKTGFVNQRPEENDCRELGNRL